MIHRNFRIVMIIAFFCYGISIKNESFLQPNKKNKISQSREKKELLGQLLADLILLEAKVIENSSKVLQKAHRILAELLEQEHAPVEHIDNFLEKLETEYNKLKKNVEEGKNFNDFLTHSYSCKKK